MAKLGLTWPKVLLYGDSITQQSFSPDSGWGAAITDKLQRKCDVLNRGFSGYNSRWNLILLPRIIDRNLAKELVAITIFLGANDSVVKDLNPKQHVPLDEYKENISKMLDYLTSVGVQREKVIIIGPPPCNDSAWQQYCQAEGKVFSKDDKQTALYSQACQQTATEQNIEFVELYNSMKSDQDWPRFLSDGLHLSAEGSKFLFNKLWPCVEKRTSHLPELIMPHWSAVDHNNPWKSLLSSS